MYQLARELGSTLDPILYTLLNAVVVDRAENVELLAAVPRERRA